jgi:4-amino-4-deoxy-L-arabinose transferase-like glycosyltransferase
VARRRIPRPLALLLGVAALLSTAWTFTTAPLLGPDEPAHFNYAQHLAETGHRPTAVGGPQSDSTQTITALVFPNLGQLPADRSARPAWSEFEERRFDEAIRFFGEKAEEDGVGPNPLGKNPPLYYAYQVIPYAIGSSGSYWDRLTLMRLASGLLFLATVAFAWLAAGELFRSAWPRTLATACVALLPQLGFISGTVNADNLLITVWTAFAFAALRLVRRGPTIAGTVAVCGIAGLSLLTHGRGTAIVVPLAVTLLAAFARARPPARLTAAALGAGLSLLGAMLAVYRLFLTPAGGAYGGEINVAAPGFNIGQLLAWTWQFYLPRLPLMDARNGPPYGYRQVMIESFFGQFGAVDTPFGRPLYDLIQRACALGLIALVVVVIARWPAVRARWAQVAVLGSMVVGKLALLHTASYRALVGGPDPLITGRYLLPLAVVFGCTVAFVVSSLPRRAGAIVGAVCLAGLVALSLGGLLITVTRFYA